MSQKGILSVQPLQSLDTLDCDLLGGSSHDGRKWLITMVSTVSPLRIGLRDPFQMVFLWLINGG